jgi:NAD(P)-dependent dehydrogenase (short-subunit alcohol dehydrogenase family)
MQHTLPGEGRRAAAWVGGGTLACLPIAVLRRPKPPPCSRPIASPAGRRQHPGAAVEVGPALDLASMDSVRAFAAAYERSGQRLDVLINNAGEAASGCSAGGPTKAAWGGGAGELCDCRRCMLFPALDRNQRALKHRRACTACASSRASSAVSPAIAPCSPAARPRPAVQPPRALRPTPGTLALAGTNYQRPWATPEGVGGLCQVNYLGPYALTRLLEATLQRSAPSRVSPAGRRCCPTAPSCALA